MYMICKYYVVVVLRPHPRSLSISIELRTPFTLPTHISLSCLFFFYVVAMCFCNPVDTRWFMDDEHFHMAAAGELAAGARWRCTRCGTKCVTTCISRGVTVTLPWCHCCVVSLRPEEQAAQLPARSSLVKTWGSVPSVLLFDLRFYECINDVWSFAFWWASLIEQLTFW